VNLAQFKSKIFLPKKIAEIWEMFSTLLFGILLFPPPPNFPSENVNFKTDELGFNVMKGTINEGRSSRAM